MKKIVLILAALALNQTLPAQTIQAKKLDSYFKTLEDSNDFMGSVSVVVDGKEEYSKTVGYADLDAKIRADSDSKYGIGSISKTFTAVLIFKAIESGDLALDQTLDRFFPQIPNAKKITIAQMLLHRSGIHDYLNNPDFLKRKRQPKTREQMVAIIGKYRSDFTPGSKHAYSNSNYVLLSYILEMLYNQPYADILEQEIVEPLGLDNTSFGAKPEVKNGDCNPYVYKDKWHLAPRSDPSILMGAGGLTSTPYDLTLFAEALFGGRLLTEASLTQMTEMKDRMGKDSIGMGLNKIPFLGTFGYGHTGRIDGFNSIFVYFPTEKISCAIISNGLNYALSDIMKALLSGVIDKPVALPASGTGTHSIKNLPKR